MNDQRQCTSYIHYNSPMLTICVHLTLLGEHNRMTFCSYPITPEWNIGWLWFIDVDIIQSSWFYHYLRSPHTLLSFIVCTTTFERFLLVTFSIMAAHTYPCPGYGLGAFDLGSRYFKAHLCYCSKSKQNDPQVSTPTPDSSMDPSSSRLFQSDRGLLESIWNTTSNAFESTNVNKMGTWWFNTI